MTTENNTNIRTIADLEYARFETFLEDHPLELYLDDSYPAFISGNSYKTIRNKENNLFKNVEEIFNYIISEVMKKGQTDAFIYIMMGRSQIGKPTQKGYVWQRLPEAEKWRLISLNRILHQKRLKRQEEEYLATIEDPFGVEVAPQQQDPIPLDSHLYDPFLLAKVDKELDLRMVGEQRNRLIVFLGACSVFLLSKPIGCAGSGHSSVGKSMVFETVLKHFPEKRPSVRNEFNTGWFLCNNIKEAALFRLENHFIDHSIFYLGEMPDQLSETQKELFGYLRQLQSEGKIQKTLSEQVADPSGIQNWAAVTYRVQGEISFFACSVFGFEEQFGNRQVQLSFDESEQQTNRISDWKTEIQMYGTERQDIAIRLTVSDYITSLIKDLDKFFFKHHEVLVYQNPYAIYVARILKKLYSFNIQLRRVIDYTFRVIEIITRIHSLNRPIGISTIGAISNKVVATGEDNLIALYLLWDSLEQAIRDITIPDKEILSLIKDALKNNLGLKLQKNSEREEGEWWTANNMAKAIKKSTTTVGTACRNLQRAGYLISKAGNTSGKWFKYQLSEKPISSHSIAPSDFLPFFLPPNISCYFGLGYRTDFPEMIYTLFSSDVLDMPILGYLFRDSRFYSTDQVARVLFIYNILGTGKIQLTELQRSTKLEDLYFSKYLTNIYTNRGVYHFWKSSAMVEWREQILWKWSLELSLGNGAIEYNNSASKEKKPKISAYDKTQKATQKAMQDQIDKILLIKTRELKEGEIGVELSEIIKELREIFKNTYDSSLMYKAMQFLSYQGIIRSPKDPYWKHNDVV